MRLATKSAISTFEQNPHLLPPNLTSTTIGTLITFCLDKSYLEFNGSFYSQDEGGTMGSPLIVELAEIRLAEVETLALSTSPDPPSFYSHFVDDGCGAFKDKDHAETYLTFLNSLTENLTFSWNTPPWPWLIFTLPRRPNTPWRLTSPPHSSVYRKAIHKQELLEQEKNRLFQVNNEHEITKVTQRSVLEVSTERKVCFQFFCFLCH